MIQAVPFRYIPRAQFLGQHQVGHIQNIAEQRLQFGENFGGRRHGLLLHIGTQGAGGRLGDALATFDVGMVPVVKILMMIEPGEHILKIDQHYVFLAANILDQ